MSREEAMAAALDRLTVVSARRRAYYDPAHRSRHPAPPPPRPSVQIRFRGRCWDGTELATHLRRLMSGFDPDAMPDLRPMSDWDLLASIRTISGLDLPWPAWKAYHHLLLVHLRREARRRGFDSWSQVEPTDRSYHCPPTRPVV